MTVGLISGYRNVTLVWVVVAPRLGELPLVEAFLAASVFPIFMLPLLTKPLIARLARTSPPPLPLHPRPVLMRRRGLFRLPGPSP